LSAASFEARLAQRRGAGSPLLESARAFLDASSIRKETRDRILKVASEIGYFHNKTASSLASRRLRASR